MRTTTLMLSALLLTAGAASASDDLTIVSKDTTNGKPAETRTTYLGSDHVRRPGGRGQEMIVDAKTGVITTLDAKKKTYYTTTKADMDEAAAKFQEKMNSPEAKQGMAMMKGMTDAMASEPIVVTKTGKTREIAGFHCEDWTVKMNEFTTITECVAEKLQVNSHAYDAFKNMFGGMSQPFASPAMAKRSADYAEKMKALKGYPVFTSAMSAIMGQKTTVVTEVTEVRRGAIPASTWEVPADYTKVENPMLKAMDRPRGRSPRR